jgi:pilus assembly protein CpaF
MRLSERLKDPQIGAGQPAPKRVDAAAPTALGDFKASVQQGLYARLGTELFDSSLSPTQLTAQVSQEITSLMDSSTVPLSISERQELASAIVNDVVGLGPIEQFLADPDVSEVMVNALDYIYVERRGKIERTDAQFLSVEHLRRVVERIVADVGRRIDESSPMVDARLPDGSRVNAIVPPLAVDGPSLTIRKFAADPFQVDDLVSFGTLTPELAELLDAVVRSGLNVLVSGGTGTGKTTLLNVLSSFIPDSERIVTIEDAVELQLRQRHVVRLESRPPNIEGRGEVTVRDLVRNSLRMRPDRIIVGEVRGSEALDMLQAMNTGHDGSISTIHCNSPRDAFSRLETMVLMTGLDLPNRAIREQIAAAIDVVVHLQRMPDGTRQVVQVTEVTGMEGEVISASDIYSIGHRPTGVDADGVVPRRIRPTGVRPMFTQRLLDQGIELPAELFGGISELPKRNGSSRS